MIYKVNALVTFSSSKPLTDHTSGGGIVGIFLGSGSHSRRRGESQETRKRG